MKVKDWPVGERPREKLLTRGAEALSDAELLALFIRTGTKGHTALDIGRALLNHFGSLRQLLDAPTRELLRQPGLGPAKVVELQAALELGRRHLGEHLSRQDVFRNPADTRRYVATRLRGLPQEVFAALLLDNQHQLIRYEELSRGTIDSAAVHPREVVKHCLQHNAAAVIFAHNHPSGLAEPSSADRSLTRRLADALALVDIRTLDHLVVGEGEICSFAERGWL